MLAFLLTIACTVSVNDFTLEVPSLDVGASGQGIHVPARPDNTSGENDFRAMYHYEDGTVLTFAMTALDNNNICVEGGMTMDVHMNHTGAFTVNAAGGVYPDGTTDLMSGFCGVCGYGHEDMTMVPGHNYTVATVGPRGSASATFDHHVKYAGGVMVGAYFNQDNEDTPPSRRSVRLHARCHHVSEGISRRLVDLITILCAVLVAVLGATVCMYRSRRKAEASKAPEALEARETPLLQT